jgi:hypothetical protein
MKKVVLNIPDNKLSFFLELVKNLGFAKVEEKHISNEQHLQELKDAVRELALIEKGKVQSRSLNALINEL